MRKEELHQLRETNDVTPGWGVADLSFALTCLTCWRLDRSAKGGLGTSKSRSGGSNRTEAHRRQDHRNICHSFFVSHHEIIYISPAT